MPKSTLVVVSLLAGLVLGVYLQRHWLPLDYEEFLQSLPADDEYAIATDNGEPIEGEGSTSWPNGDHYVGAFKNGLMHGQGTLSYANGDRYSGGFRYGRQHGEGEWRSADPDDEVHSYRGEWSRGRLIAARGDLTIYSPEEIAEHALYQQPQLLARALATVRPGDDHRIELFSLGIAAYGSEEVFRREINYLQSEVLPGLSRPEHSILLSNSRRSLADRPLATLTSIEDSLHTLGRNMNREQDILFLYITSHGGRDQTLSVQQPGLSLPDLSAKTLRQLLDDSGIRWRVVVLSACYSGGFIEPLADDNTLILTAAAADKTSFGCADERDFTYFGDALFRQALPTSDNFIDAFEVAKGHIAEWEQSDGIEPSNPQISIGNRIRPQLEAWRRQANAE